MPTLRSQPYEFGRKTAAFLDDYQQQFKNMYGTDLRLPHDYTALRQMGVASGIGGLLGLARGTFWPGYHEKTDAQGNIIAKKRRSPWLGALEGAAIGAGTSALSNYAGQIASQYTPEIDKLLMSAKNKALAFAPVEAVKKYENVDVSPLLFDKITTTV